MPGWFGNWFGGSALPVLTSATTADAIRDRVVAIMHGLTPTYVPGSKLRAYRNEGDGDFIAWCEQNPAGAFRRFQARFDGSEGMPIVSSGLVEERNTLITVLIAYPHDARTGSKQALDRDTAIDRDKDILERHIGLLGRGNFTAPNPDACCYEWDCIRQEGGACDYLVVAARYSFYRQL